MASNKLVALAAFLFLSVVFGCGGKPEAKRFLVSGAVTLDGEPLADGVVQFKTVATGAFDSIPIKDGKFAGEAEAGERRVEISSVTTKIIDPDRMKTEVQVNHVAKKFNTDSKLTATVKPEGPNEFNFEVTSK